MRINMHNRSNLTSANVDIENLDMPIELRIRKVKKFISKRFYYRICLSSLDDRFALLVNKEQLISLSKQLNDYVAEGNHNKRTDSKASDFQGQI